MSGEGGKDEVDGGFSEEDDRKMLKFVKECESSSGSGRVVWETIGSVLGRSVRQCRERYLFHLCCDKSNPGWSASEDDLLRKQVSVLGRCFGRLVHFFPGRSESSVRNRWSVLRHCGCDCGRYHSSVYCFDEGEEEEEEESLEPMFDEEDTAADGGDEKAVLSVSDAFYMTTELDGDLKPVQSGAFRKSDVLDFSASHRVNDCD